MQFNYIFLLPAYNLLSIKMGWLCCLKNRLNSRDRLLVLQVIIDRLQKVRGDTTNLIVQGTGRRNFYAGKRFKGKGLYVI